MDGSCGCTPLKNPLGCVYQPFLDGWDFTPDVGNGGSRGEIFTPRFIVDKMIVDAHILPSKAVYRFDYRGSQQTLRKYIGARVFEPAVGTGNFIATILWHKLQMAHEITGYTGDRDTGFRKSASQLRRYQTYTLVALGSLYFNDIDPGNLQTTKWRLLRDNEIGTDINIDFWTDHIAGALVKPVAASRIRRNVRASIKQASLNWGTADRDRGVLDSLYEAHTSTPAPGWLREAWKQILDENAKLFNAISPTDDVESPLPIPGSDNVAWTFWRFENTTRHIRAFRTEVPLALQIADGGLREIEESLTLIPMKDDPSGAADLFTGDVPQVPDGKEAGERHRALVKKRRALQAARDAAPTLKEGATEDFWTREASTSRVTHQPPTR